MAASFAGRKNRFNAVVEGAFERFNFSDLTYKAVYLPVPPSAVLLDDTRNTYLLYARTRNLMEPDRTMHYRGRMPTEYRRPSEPVGIVKAELPKGTRLLIPDLEAIEGMHIYYQDKEPAPDVLECPRLIMMRDGRIFLARKVWEETPFCAYTDSISEAISEARNIFNSKEFAEAWDLL